MARAATHTHTTRPPSSQPKPPQQQPVTRSTKDMTDPRLIGYAEKEGKPTSTEIKTPSEE